MEKEVLQFEACVKDVSKALQKHYAFDADLADGLAMVQLYDNLKPTKKAIAKHKLSKIRATISEFVVGHWGKVIFFPVMLLLVCLAVRSILVYNTETPLPHTATVGIFSRIFDTSGRYACIVGSEICVNYQDHYLFDATVRNLQEGQVYVIPTYKGRELVMTRKGNKYVFTERLESPE